MTIVRSFEETVMRRSTTKGCVTNDFTTQIITHSESTDAGYQHREDKM